MQATPLLRDPEEVSLAATIRLRTNKFRMMASLKGWRTDDAISKALGLNPATVSRNLRSAQDPRGTAPGERFIAAVLAALPEVPFHELFEIVGSNEAMDDEQASA
jgi:hypothetical protein